MLILEVFWDISEVNLKSSRITISLLLLVLYSCRSTFVVMCDLFLCIISETKCSYFILRVNNFLYCSRAEVPAIVLVALCFEVLLHCLCVQCVSLSLLHLI